MRIVAALLLLLVCLTAASAGALTGASAPTNPYAMWPNSFPADPGFFPIAVWLQSPKHAAEYKALGINTYVGVSEDLTDEMMEMLRKQGIYAVTDQSIEGWTQRDHRVITAWMHGDEPDNAQSKPEGGYGPGIPTAKIIAEYKAMKEKDPTRPVLLNLGVLVADDDWIGRGCTLFDYPEYVKGSDIVSFDIYPMAGFRKPDGENWLWYVARGVDRLQRWTRGQKIVWNCIETTHIRDPQHKPNGDQLKAEVWMSLIHGSKGLIYFVHQFKPEFHEAGLLEDKAIQPAVKAVNEQITALAPVLNSPTIEDGTGITSSNPLVPVDVMVRELR